MAEQSFSKEVFPYTEGIKRYHTLFFDNKQRFGRRVMKACIDAGFTCPNLDGTKGRGGCAYCAEGSGQFAPGQALSPVEQLHKETERIRNKWPDAGIIAYFQAHSNTHGKLERLKAVYEPVAAAEGICGLSIVTRADCLPDDVLDYLAQLARRMPLTVELGLQTIHEGTASLINRCYGYDVFLKAFEKLKKRNIRVCIHIINGLPGEDEDMMIETAQEVGNLHPDGIKIHLLHILKGTAMEKMWKRGDVVPMEREAYIRVVCTQLEWLPPETVIERLTGDGMAEILLAPLWSRYKIAVLGGIDKALADRQTWQGRLCR